MNPTAEAPSRPVPSAPRSREFGLDWLRVGAFAILIFFHTGMFFVRWPWHVKNNQLSSELEWVMVFFGGWRLALLFFISGCGVAFALRRRSLSTFAGERVRRLLLPLVFGMLVVVPPQVYFERLTEGVRFEGYLDFYRSVFRFQPYPEGNFSWHHLWFVAYILVYSLAMIPAFAALGSAGGRSLLAAFVSACQRPGVIYLVNLPSWLLATVLGPRWPTTHNLIADWANLTGSLATFMWGFVFASAPGMLDLVERRRREWLVGAIALTFVFYAVRVFDPGLGHAVRALVGSYFGMFWIFTLVGYSRKYLNRDSPQLRYATEAVYPFYILHQTITVAAGYVMAGWPWPVFPKLVLLALVTFFGSWMVYETIRRNAITRVFFGLKPSVG